MNATQINLAARSMFQPMGRKVQTPVATHGVKSLAFSTREEQEEHAAKEEQAAKEAKAAKRAALRADKLSAKIHNASIKVTESATIADQARAILAARKMQAEHKVASLGETETTVKAKKESIALPPETESEKAMRLACWEVSYVKGIKAFHRSLAGTGFVLGMPCDVAREGTSLVRSLVLAFFAGTEDAMADDDQWTESDRANAIDCFNSAPATMARMGELLAAMGVKTTPAMLFDAVRECFYTEHALMADAL